MALLYREAFGDIKKDKEADYDEADRVFEKFSYMKDQYSLRNHRLQRVG